MWEVTLFHYICSRSYFFALWEVVKTKSTIGHEGQPEDVANIVSFLVSEKAGYITGQAVSFFIRFMKYWNWLPYFQISVDGGWHMNWDESVAGRSLKLQIVITVMQDAILCSSIHVDLTDCHVCNIRYLRNVWCDWTSGSNWKYDVFDDLGDKSVLGFNSDLRANLLFNEEFESEKNKTYLSFALFSSWFSSFFFSSLS